MPKVCKLISIVSFTTLDMMLCVTSKNRTLFDGECYEIKWVAFVFRAVDTFFFPGLTQRILSFFIWGGYGGGYGGNNYGGGYGGQGGRQNQQKNGRLMLTDYPRTGHFHFFFMIPPRPPPLSLTTNRDDDFFTGGPQNPDPYSNGWEGTDCFPVVEVKRTTLTLTRGGGTLLLVVTHGHLASFF